MALKPHVLVSDLFAGGLLAADATIKLTELVESMHETIARAPRILGGAPGHRTRGITGLVYASIRGITRSIRWGVGGASRWIPEAKLETSRERESVIAALNGVLGDHLERTQNSLAIPMELREAWRKKDRIEAPSNQGFSTVGQRLLILVHGLCMTDQQWMRGGHDHGEQLARDFGFTPIYLRYNSGLHISENGRRFAAALEDLLQRWPEPEEIVIIGHSMGGLVTRSACHYGSAARHQWRRKLTKVIFLGSPHHGAPLENLGHRLQSALAMSPYTAALARLGRLRSSGITDLRHAAILDQDRRSRDRFEDPQSPREPRPLPSDVACYTIAASLMKGPAFVKDRVGDGLVPIRSALGEHEDPRLDLQFPESRTAVIDGAHHLDLLDHDEVYTTLKTWLAAPHRDRCSQGS